MKFKPRFSALIMLLGRVSPVRLWKNSKSFGLVVRSRTFASLVMNGKRFLCFFFLETHYLIVS